VGADVAGGVNHADIVVVDAVGQRAAINVLPGIADDRGHLPGITAVDTDLHVFAVGQGFAQRAVDRQRRIVSNEVVTAAAGIINFVVLTAALSGCNSGMYSCGRMLYALAKNRQLPRAMAKVSRHGVPVMGVAVSIAILLVGSCLNYIIPNPQRVFVYVYSASVLPGMVPWFVILISQLRFRETHRQALASHPFRSVLFPYANWLTMAFLVCVLIGMGINEDTRMSLFVGVIFLAAVTLLYKVFGLSKRAEQAGSQQ